jgi:hypothetical protein
MNTFSPVDQLQQLFNVSVLQTLWRVDTHVRMNRPVAHCGYESRPTQACGLICLPYYYYRGNQEQVAHTRNVPDLHQAFPRIVLLLKLHQIN